MGHKNPICAVYRVYCIETDKSYVGSSNCIQVRWSHHKGKLVRGVHENSNLQSDYNLGFTLNYEILEETTEEDLLMRERHHMSLFTDDKLYNLQRISEDGGVIFSSETRAKISDNNRGRFYSSETRAKIGAANRGRTLPPRSAEHSAKISAANKGKIFSEEHRAKISAAKKAVFAARKIIQITDRRP
jgi:group I intron endonuclease